MRNRKNEHNVEDDNEIAQNVYGDLMTFLMSLFLLLFIVSQQTKYDGYFIIDKQDKTGGASQQITQSDLTQQNPVISNLKSLIKKEKLEKKVFIKEDEQKVKLILESPVLFASGSAKLSKEAIQLVRKIANILKDVENRIVIEGHTDNVPIKTKKYQSNWELSFFRAYAVTDYLINKEKFNPIQLSCQGYGEYSPIRPNTSRKNKAKNRRIEINIIRIITEDEKANKNT
eukprot:SAG22_NODE_486_length_9885_cov_2.043634_5_plen_229_part_00